MPARLKFSLPELSGGMGDLGTFLPLVVAVAIACRLDMAMILICAGLMNMATGLLFRQPIPVQPMKAIAAVAITEALHQDRTVPLLTAACVLGGNTGLGTLAGCAAVAARALWNRRRAGADHSSRGERWPVTPWLPAGNICLHPGRHALPPGNQDPPGTPCGS